MNHLATIFPAVRRRRLPLSRDQIMLLMAAFNEFMLGVDTYLAHVLSGEILPREWIPILFGPTAAVGLLLSGWIALRNRPLAARLATLVFLSSVVVGVLGAYFHLIRGILPAALPGQRISVSLLVWAPPVLAPFAFAGIGILGISAAWAEEPADSGTLLLGATRKLRLPYSKTQAYLFLVSLGILVSVVSSALDHARHGFENPWLWLPLAAGVFAIVASSALALVDNPTRTDLLTYLAAMVLMIAVGILGAYFHIRADLSSQNVIVAERFLRGAPFMSPLLFSNMGMVGIIALLSPKEESPE